MGMYTQEEFEAKIMEMLLTSENPVAKILKNQYDHSEVKSRKYSGAGFFTHFRVEAGAMPAPKKSFEVGGVSADIGDIKDALGFLLLIRGSFIDWLEGYTLSVDDWPENYKDVVLKFDNPNGIADYEKI